VQDIQSSIKLEGWEDLIEQLRAIRDGFMKKGLVQIAQAGADVLLEQVQADCPVGDSGCLLASMTTKVKLYLDHYYPIALAMVGPDATYARVVDGKLRVPANYAHNVEFGHRMISHEATLTDQWTEAQRLRSSAFRRTRGREHDPVAERIMDSLAEGMVVEHPFMRPAMDACHDAVLDAMREKAEEVLAAAVKETARLRRKVAA
jgi:hypothetical protein